MKSLVTLTILTMCLAGASAQVCVSSSPNTGNSVAVSPNFNPGDTLTMYASALLGPTAVVQFTTNSGEEVVQDTMYSTAVTGTGALFRIPAASANLQTITSTWLDFGNVGDATPLLIVCDVGQLGDLTKFQGYSTGTWVTSLKSGFASFILPAIAEYCVAAGDTPMSQFIAGDGWFIPSGAAVDHAACQFREFEKPWVGRANMSWTGSGMHTYGVLAGWLQ